MLDKVNIGDIIFANPENYVKQKANSILFVTGKKELEDVTRYICQDVFTGSVHTIANSTSHYISYSDMRYMMNGYKLLVRAMHVTSSDPEADTIKYMNRIHDATVYLDEMASGVLLDRFTRRGFGVGNAREMIHHIATMDKLMTIEEIDEMNNLEVSKITSEVADKVNGTTAE